MTPAQPSPKGREKRKKIKLKLKTKIDEPFPLPSTGLGGVQNENHQSIKNQSLCLGTILKSPGGT